MAGKHSPPHFPGRSHQSLESEARSLSERLDQLAGANWTDSYSNMGDYLNRADEPAMVVIEEENTALADIRDIARSYPQFRPDDYLASPARIADGSKVDLPIGGGAIVPSGPFEVGVAGRDAAPWPLRAVVAGAVAGAMLVGLLALLV